jgi:hypothetical protein
MNIDTVHEHWFVLTILAQSIVMAIENIFNHLDKLSAKYIEILITSFNDSQSEDNCIVF